jgi:hypothetical protein
LGPEKTSGQAAEIRQSTDEQTNQIPDVDAAEQSDAVSNLSAVINMFALSVQIG